MFAAQRVVHRYISLLEPKGRDLTIMMVDLAWNFLARFKDFYWGPSVGTEAMYCLGLCRATSSVAPEEG